MSKLTIYLLIDGVKKLPKYVCTVIDKDGNRSKQRIEAPSQEVVAESLKARNYYLVSVKEEGLFDKEIEFGGNGIINSKRAIRC